MKSAQAEPGHELYDKLRWHVGHQIEVHGLGPVDQVDPQHIVVQCITCHKPLVEAVRPKR